MRTARQGWVCFSTQVCRFAPFALLSVPLLSQSLQACFLLKTQSYIYDFADATGLPRLTASQLRPCKIYLGFKQNMPSLSTATAKVGSFLQGWKAHLGGSWTHRGGLGAEVHLQNVLRIGWISRRCFVLG